MLKKTSVILHLSDIKIFELKITIFEISPSFLFNVANGICSGIGFFFVWVVVL